MGPTAHDSYRLRADAALTMRDDGALVLRQGRHQLVLDGLSVGRRSLALRVAEAWATDVDLNELVAAVEGESRILSGQIMLRGLLAHSWLRRRLHADGRTLTEVTPRGLGAGSLPRTVIHEPGVRYRLSRFAVTRPLDGRLVTETPLSTLAVAAVDPLVGAALVVAAADGVDVAGLAAQIGLDQCTAGRILDDLLTARILLGAAEAESEHDASPLAGWSPEELWLHDRSRPGRHVLPVGGTYRLRGRLEPEPLARTFADHPAIDLVTPDMDVVAKSDAGLTEIVDARRTIRRHDPDRPITVAQLAEFLYRVQRLTRTTGGDGIELGGRPYPSGGSVYELEVYAIVHACTGLDPGVYHYDSAGHRLVRLAPLEPAARRAVAYVTAAATFTETPQVCLVTTARVGRLMWKYEGLAYALVLKHAGVLTELMYLVATAMGLAPCAVGAGDAAAFAAATGVDALAEPSVAEFVLGSCLPGDAPALDRRGCA